MRGTYTHWNLDFAEDVLHLADLGFDQISVEPVVAPPEEDYAIPLGTPDMKRAGNDLTILTVGPALYPAMRAAERLEHEFRLSAEVIDARSLVPFDFEPVVQSVRKTGRILVVSDACERGSWIQTLSARIARYCFDDLDAPPVAIGAPNEISPCPELEKTYYPQPEWILDAIHTHAGHGFQRRGTDAAGPSGHLTAQRIAVLRFPFRRAVHFRGKSALFYEKGWKVSHTRCILYAPSFLDNPTVREGAQGDSHEKSPHSHQTRQGR